MPNFKNISKKNGVKKWSVVFDLPGYEKRKQKRLSGFNTRQEANSAYLAFMKNYKPPSESDEGDFAKTFRIFMKDFAYSVKESTYISYEADFRNHILPILGDKQIKDLRPHDISDWIIRLSEKNLCYRTKIKLKGFVSHFMNFCIDFGLIEINPCKKAIKIKNTEVKKDMIIWSEVEFVKFISVINDLVYKSFFSFLYLTGCRRGEALAITWNDINNYSVKINKTLGYHTINGGYSITIPKNTYSNREIIIPESLKLTLDKLKQMYVDMNLYEDTNFVFGGKNPLPPQSIRNKLKKYCMLADIKKIRVHDFRHSHASLLISKSHDIVTISRRLGHADIKMTLNSYAHLMPNKQYELMDTLNIEL